jgi:glycerophosphoryl diester phosphodiesterase
MPVLNIAHRGARSLAPENTLAAARKALLLGADLWETDVLVTADEQLILMHDDTLERTTDVATRFPDRSPWTVTTFALAEIETLAPGTRFLERDPFGQIAAGAVTPGEQAAYICEPVPTLAGALTFTQKSGWQVNLELKRVPPPMDRFPIVERVLDLIDRLAIEHDRVVISSFNHAWLRQVRQLQPGLAVQALVGPLPLEPAPEFQVYNASERAVDEAAVRAAVRRGLSVNLYTVNDEGDMRRFIAAGVSGLFTDYPQRLSAILAA